MSLAMHWPVLAVAIPLTTAPIAILLRDRTLSWVAALAASLCTFAIAITLAYSVLETGPISYMVGGFPAPYGIELRVDAFSALLLLIVAGSSTTALLIARESLGREMAPNRQPLYFSAWLLALAGLAGIVVAGDAFNIFVFLEISALSTYVLIAGGPRREALTAVFKYIILGTIGATFYLIGVGYVYMMTGTLNIADMAERLQAVSNLTPIFIAGAFITVGLALKAAVMPLHTWLPNAYAQSPHAATIFIAACSTKVALYALVRIDFALFQGTVPDHETVFRLFLLPLGIAAMIIASGVAIFERDLKRMLAYSSIAHIGYIVFGVALATHSGITGGIAHMFNHALAKGTLFLAVACIGLGGAAISFDQLAGTARRMPLTMAAFVIAGLSLIGIPGTAGFIGKFYLVVGAIEFGTPGLLIVVPLLLSSVLAVMYVWRAVATAYFDPPLQGGSERREAPAVMLAVLLVAAAANIYFGLDPSLPLGLADQAATLLTDLAG